MPAPTFTDTFTGTLGTSPVGRTPDTGGAAFVLASGTSTAAKLDGSGHLTATSGAGASALYTSALTTPLTDFVASFTVNFSGASAGVQISLDLLDAAGNYFELQCSSAGLKCYSATAAPVFSLMSTLPFPTSNGTVITITISRVGGRTTVQATGGYLAYWREVTVGTITSVGYHVQGSNATLFGPVNLWITGGTMVAGATILGRLTSTTVRASCGLATFPAGTVNYQFQRAPDAAGVPGTFVNVGSNTTSNIFDDTGRSVSTKYWYQAICTDGTTTATTPPASITTLASNPSTKTIWPDDPVIYYSPGIWSVNAASGGSVAPGAYFRFYANTTTCVLNFDTSKQGACVIQMAYRVDSGPWTGAAYASTIDVTGGTPLPTGFHVIEVAILYTSGSGRWNGPGGAYLTSISVASGATVVAPPTAPLKILVFGDSRTEGYDILYGSSGGVSNSSISSYAMVLREYLGAEVGFIGYSGQGMSIPGNAGEPKLVTSFASVWNGASGGILRSFSGVDYVLEVMGYNDQAVAGATLQADYLSFFAGLVANGIPVSRILKVLWGDAALATATPFVLAACSAAGVAVTAAIPATNLHSTDGIHYTAGCNRAIIAPFVAAQAEATIFATATVTSYKRVGLNGGF